MALPPGSAITFASGGGTLSACASLLHPPLFIFCLPVADRLELVSAIVQSNQEDDSVLREVGGMPELVQPPQESAVRGFLRGRGSSALADGFFRVLMLLCALSIFGIVVLIAVEL